MRATWLSSPPTVDDPDNSKLYVHDGVGWVYLSDLSGVEGVGIAGISQTDGNHAPGTTDTYTIELTNGAHTSSLSTMVRMATEAETCSLLHMTHRARRKTSSDMRTMQQKASKTS